MLAIAPPDTRRTTAPEDLALHPLPAGRGEAAPLPGIALRRALLERRLRVDYQPIVRLHDARIVGHEALARILDPAGQLLAADSFIDTAAEMAIEPYIDSDVSEQVMTTAHSEPNPFLPDRGKRFINCSSAFLIDPTRIQRLAEHHRRWARARTWSRDEDVPWVLEITERNLDVCPQRLRSTVAPLLDLGFQLALDDFGGKNSAFPHLLQMPIRYLKIDKGLVQGAMTDARSELALHRVADLARSLGMTAIAEGIETPAMRDRVLAAGVAWGQGYLWGMPSPHASHGLPPAPHDNTVTQSFSH